jgi:site-specific DNA recombinase
MRVAFYGRVSTNDAPDPSLSIPRQLGKCDQVLDPIGEKVRVNFWDVESGRKALAERGKGTRDWSDVVDVPAPAACQSCWQAQRRERSTQ